MPRFDDGPLVGRDDDLGRLTAAVDRALAGRGAGVLLAGDAGVGKTRVLDELVAAGTRQGRRVLVGHCLDLGDVGLPYLPFVDLLRPVAADPELAAEVAGAPALAGLLAGRPAGAAPPVTEAPGDLGATGAQRALRPPADDGRLQLFEAVAGLLAGVATRAPLLLVIEDLHWADRSSRDLLRYLLARLVDEPVALVGSYRSDDLHRRHPLRPLLAELVRLPGVERLALGPLADDDVAALVRGLAPGGLPETAVDDVVARAEGNAFYAEELAAAGLAGEALPLGLSDVLLARVEQLSPAGQQVLRIAAVAGRRVRHELLVAVGGLAPEDLEAALAEAVHRHLLVVPGDGRYRFRHALLREAVLADLLPGERTRLHAAVAAHLAAVPGAGTAAERAFHARQSNDLAGALSAALEAADEARRVGAPAEQLQQVEAALALWPSVPDAAQRVGRGPVDLLLDAAAAARRIGELARGVALLRAAVDALGEGADPAVLARVRYTLAQSLSRIGDDAGAVAESAAAVALVPAEPPSVVRTWALATHARTTSALDRVAEAEAAATEALAAADALDLDSAWADTALSLARVRGRDGDTDARLAEALVRARRSGDPDVELRALFYRASTAVEAGDLTAAWARADEGLRRAAELGVEWSFYGARMRHLAMVARYGVGDWDGALALAGPLSRAPDSAAHVRATALLVLAGRGDPAVAPGLARVRELAGRLDGDAQLLLETAGVELEVAGWAGDAAGAVAAATAAARRLEQLWGADRLAVLRLAALALGPVGDAAAAARLTGDAAAVQRWTAAGAGLVTAARAAVRAYEDAVGPVGGEGRAWAARLDAEEARLAGRPAPELWRAAVAAFGGHVPEVARSRWRLAGALLATEDRDGATGQLQEAHRAAVALGARPLQEALLALARRGRLDTGLPGARAADPAAVLTAREAEVLALLAEGRTNRQIGAALFISEKTASVHVSNILAKLGASGRTEAVAVAARRGLLTA